MKHWLRVFRAQTAPATVYAITLPYIIAGGDYNYIPLLVLIGTIIHFASFGHNSVMDYWWDLNDPNKKHHPLESGIISLDKAHVVVHSLMVVSAILSIILTLFISPAPSIALSMLLLYVIFGHAYNDGLDKVTSLSFIPISLCFTFAGLWGWFLATREVNTTTFLIALWAFLTILYQIGWEGNLKDIFNPSETKNMLKRLGVTYTQLNGNFYAFKLSKSLNYAFMIIRAVGVLVIVPIILVLNYDGSIQWYLSLIAYLFTDLVEIYYLFKLHADIMCKPMSRDTLLEYFGVLESFVFFNLMTVIILFNPVLFVLLFLYGMGWFIVMNKWLWGSRFGPRV